MGQRAQLRKVEDVTRRREKVQVEMERAAWEQKKRHEKHAEKRWAERQKTTVDQEEVRGKRTERKKEQARER